MSEPDLAKQAIEEGAASVPTEVSAAVGAPSSADGGETSPIPAEAAPRLQKGSTTYLRDTRGLLLSVVASAGLLPVLLLVATDSPTPADQAPLPAAPAAALDAPSLAPAITSAPVAPLPAPDGSGSGEADGQPAAYKPVAFAWVIELGDGPYLLTSLGEAGSSYTSPPRGTNGDEPPSYGDAFQSYRGMSPNPAFDSWMQKKFILYGAAGTRCEAVAEDVGQLAWFIDHDNINGDFERYIRADDGSIPWQPGLGLPALSKDGPGLSETIYALAEKDPTFMARVTMQAAYTFAAHGDDPLHSAVKLRIVSKDEACAPIESSGFPMGHIGRSAELHPIAVSAPISITKEALGLVDSRLWPSSKEIDKACGWRGRKPLQQEYDFADQPDALTWVTPDGTEHAWADYRTPGPELPTHEPDDSSYSYQCSVGLVIEGFWKRKPGSKRWTKDHIVHTPDGGDSERESSDPPFLIVDLRDGSPPSVICGRSYNTSYHTSYRCAADSNPLVYGPPQILELNDTH